jgi:hypothetical protein
MQPFKQGLFWNMVYCMYIYLKWSWFVDCQQLTGEMPSQQPTLQPAMASFQLATSAALRGGNWHIINQDIGKEMIRLTWEVTTTCWALTSSLGRPTFSPPAAAALSMQVHMETISKWAIAGGQMWTGAMQQEHAKPNGCSLRWQISFTAGWTSSWDPCGNERSTYSKVVSLSANLIWRNRLQYPTNVYDGNRLPLPILRLKMECLVYIWCLLTCLMVVDMGIKIPGIQSQYQDRK